MKTVLIGLIGLLSTAAIAQEQPRPQAPSLTEQWLTIQRNGSQASQHPQTATTAEQELTALRWLESYSHPIPDQFSTDQSMSTGE